MADKSEMKKLLLTPVLGNNPAALGDLLRDRAAFTDERARLDPGASRKMSYVEILSKLRIGEVEPVRNGTIITDANATALRAAADFD